MHTEIKQSKLRLLLWMFTIPRVCNQHRLPNSLRGKRIAKPLTVVLGSKYFQWWWVRCTAAHRPVGSLKMVVVRQLGRKFRNPDWPFSCVTAFSLNNAPCGATLVVLGSMPINTASGVLIRNVELRNIAVYWMLRWILLLSRIETAVRIRRSMNIYSLLAVRATVEVIILPPACTSVTQLGSNFVLQMHITIAITWLYSEYGFGKETMGKTIERHWHFGNKTFYQR